MVDKSKIGTFFYQNNNKNNLDCSSRVCVWNQQVTRGNTVPCLYSSSRQQKYKSEKSRERESNSFRDEEIMSSSSDDHDEEALAADSYDDELASDDDDVDVDDED